MNELDNTTMPPGATQKPPLKRDRMRRGLTLFIALSLVFVPVSAIYKYGEILAGTAFTAQSGELLRSEKRDCGIVLTGGSGRVRDGIVLLSRGQIGKLILSGVNPKSSFQDIYPDIAFYPDVSLSNVVLEKTSSSTVTNAQSSLIIVEALSCKTVVLITSDYHMYRALRTFRAVFPPTVSMEPYAVNSDQFLPGKSWILSPKALGVVMEEAFKFFFYMLTVF